MELRQHHREDAPKTMVQISDRLGFCTGNLKDFSRFGICITDISRKIHLDNGYFSIVVHYNDLHFKLNVEKRWSAKEGSSIKIGTLIVDAPCSWTDMTMAHEPA